MTQHRVILKYVKKNGSILPAKMSGRIYLKTMFGSEVSRRCRELRAKRLLKSVREDRFIRFYPTAKLLKTKL